MSNISTVFVYYCFLFCNFSRFQVVFSTKCVFCYVHPVAFFGFYSSFLLFLFSTKFSFCSVQPKKKNNSMFVHVKKFSLLIDVAIYLQWCEYKQKSAGGKMVDSSPEIEREIKTELERVAKKFAKSDMTKFPELKFPDVKIDPFTTALNIN